MIFGYYLISPMRHCLCNSPTTKSAMIYLHSPCALSSSVLLMVSCFKVSAFFLISVQISHIYKCSPTIPNTTKHFIREHDPETRTCC